MRRLGRLLPILACATVLPLGQAVADVVTDWNNVALDSIRAERVNPPRATRALAMVHIAIFNSVNGIERGYESYGRSHPAPPGTSAEAAAAEAAYTVLAALFPGRESIFAAARDASIAGIEPDQSLRKGLSFGAECGQRILDLRANDG